MVGGEVSKGSYGRNSIYTGSLLKNLNQNKSFSDILVDVTRDVTTVTNGEQMPTYTSTETERIILGNSTITPTPEPVITPEPIITPTPNIDITKKIFENVKTDIKRMNTQGKSINRIAFKDNGYLIVGNDGKENNSVGVSEDLIKKINEFDSSYHIRKIFFVL